MAMPLSKLNVTGPSDVGDAPTIRSTLNELSRDFRAGNIEFPQGDARRLLASVTGISGAGLLARPDLLLHSEQLTRLAGYRARRLVGEPVSRILGVRSFYGRDFRINAATFDPRPESETVVDATLQLIREEGWTNRPMRFIDVGTGTGCLLLSLLAELPLAVGVGTDISHAALCTAQDNADRLGVAHRASWCKTDLYEDLDGPFDVLIANPPYIRSSEIERLAPEVRLYDPRVALDGGHDGLAAYRRLIPGISLLVPNGWAVLEVGYDQAAVVTEMMNRMLPDDEQSELRRFVDLAGWWRCVAARTRIQEFE
jgi:release factor glutamine methyltransferase